MREKYKRRRRMTPVGWVLIGVGAALVLSVVWVGARGLIAKNELESALPLVSDIKDDLKAVNLGAAQGKVDIVAEKTALARSLTSDPVWRVFEFIPVLGTNLTAFRELSAATDDIAKDVMVPISSLGDSLDPAALKPVDGAIDLAVFEAAGPVIANAKTALDAAYEDVQAVDTSSTLGPITDAKERMEGMIGPLVPVMSQAAGFVTLLPQLMGSESVRNYLLVFQNNSEARSLGGHAGSWVQISVDNGKIDLVRQAPVHDLKTGGVPVYALAADQIALWPGAGTDPSNVTMVPRLDVSAETAAAFWQHRYGTKPDAVFFIDPVALGFILDATGPMELPTGDVIDGDNAASFLLNGVYRKYRTNAQHDAVFDSIAERLFDSILKGGFDPKKIVNAALKGGEEHRILAWSFVESEQELFSSLPFSLDTPRFSDKTAEFGVYITDNLGSKMTYYVDATVEVGQAQCSSGTPQYQVRMTLTNTVTAEEAPLLSNYIANGAGGALRVLVTLYAPPGSSFVRELAVGWDPTFVTINGSDGDYPAMTQRVILNPGETLTGTFVVTPPDDNLDRKLDAYVTPMARPIPVSEFDFTC